MALALGLVLLPPLLLRGPLLRWLVARTTRDLCGTFRVGEGHLGWMVVPDLLRGRPFTAELQGVLVTGPEGDEVLRVASTSAKIDIERNPWRVLVYAGVASRGRWRLAVDTTGGVGGFLGSFRPVPAGEPKDACLVPPQRRRGPRPPPPTNASFELRGMRLEDMDVDLDFPMWGLVLPRVHATGTLAVGTAGGSGFTFDVRDATAPGGELRAGPGGKAATAATTTAHFDDVVISHVGVSAEDPGNLVLEVARADTGRSRLSGTAVFENVFARHGRRGDRNPPGLSLDARWERLADAAARLDAPWLPREALGELLDGALTARVRGPFRTLTGALSIDGPRAGLEAAVAEGRRFTVDARVADLALAPFLHASLEPLLGGRVTGRLRAKVEIVPGQGEVDLEIPSADVALTRAGADAAPRRIVFRVGLPAGQAARARPDDDTLALGLNAARLRRRTLKLDGLSARWAELSANGALTLVMPARADDEPGPPARVDAEVTANLTSIARWISPKVVSARASARLTLSGPFDRLRARLSFSPSSTATILGDRYRLPGTVTAGLDDGRTLTIDGLALARVSGGGLSVHGRAERGGSVSGELRLSRYPLGGLPGLGSVFVPPALAGGRHEALRDALAGTLDADVKLSGPTSRPAFAGTLKLTGVMLAGRHLGDGDVRVRARAWSATVEGTLGPSLTFDVGATRRRDGVSADANLTLAALALGPWLPPVLAGLDVAVSGSARVVVAPHKPLTSHADLHAVGAAGELAILSTTSGDTATGSARGHLELAGLRPLWGRALADAQGTLAVDVTTSPDAPLEGKIVVARPLSLRLRSFPLTLGVAEGGQVDLDGTHVRVPALTLTAPGARLTVAGELNADLAMPQRTSVDVSANARVDAAVLAREARLPALASASGTITIDARARGELGNPITSGAARLEAVEVRPASPSLPALRVDGVIDATPHGFTTRALRVETVGGKVASGAVTLGTPGAPAAVEIGAGWPPRFARVDVPIAGHGLRVGDAKSSFAIGALDLDLRLAGDPEREVVLSGAVGLSHARFNPFGGKKKGAPGPSRPWFEALPPWLTLDVTLQGPSDALVVAVPVLPDVALGMRCRIVGNSRGATIAGQVSGRGLYSRTLLALFGPKGARECRVLKE